MLEMLSMVMVTVACSITAGFLQDCRQAQAGSEGSQYILIHEHLDLRAQPIPYVPQLSGPDSFTNDFSLGSIP